MTAFPKIIATAAGPWNGPLVMIRLSEAALALRTVPAGRSISNKLSYWPDALKDPNEAYGYLPTGMTPMRATSNDITKMDEALRWMGRWLTRDACKAAGLPDDAGWLVWLRASGWSQAKIGAARRERWNAVHIASKSGPNRAIPGGNSRPALSAIEEKALRHVASHLNRHSVALDRDTEAAVTGGRNGDGRAG
jgi:hypothetical protein